MSRVMNYLVGIVSSRPDKNRTFFARHFQSGCNARSKCFGVLSVT